MDAGTNTGVAPTTNINGAQVSSTTPGAIAVTPTPITTTTQSNNPPTVPNVPAQTVSAPSVPLITVPVPIVHNEEEYTYVMVKGSLHDRSCTVFGLNEEERQALSKRFDNIKPIVNGFMVSISPVDLVNTLAQLNYKVICSSGEAEICWTMQREI